MSFISTLANASDNFAANMSDIEYSDFIDNLAAAMPWLANNDGHKFHRASQRYESVASVDIIRELSAFGYRLTGHGHALRFPTPRKSHTGDWRAHILTLHNVNVPAIEHAGRSYRPTVVIINSGNLTKRLSVFTGFIERACMNGCVIGEIADAFTGKHNPGVNAGWLHLIRRIADKEASDLASIRAMQSVTLNPEQAIWLAGVAARLRFGDEPATIERVCSGDLLRSRRAVDRGLNLYSVFQRVQENLFAENGVRVRHGEGAETRFAYARPLTGYARHIDINTRLFDAAMSLAA